MLPFLFFSGNSYLIEQFSQMFHRRPKAQPRDVVGRIFRQTPAGLLENNAMPSANLTRPASWSSAASASASSGSTPCRSATLAIEAQRGIIRSARNLRGYLWGYPGVSLGVP